MSVTESLLDLVGESKVVSLCATGLVKSFPLPSLQEATLVLRSLGVELENITLVDH